MRMSTDTQTILAADGIILALVLWGLDKIFEFLQRQRKNELNIYACLQLGVGVFFFIGGVWLFFAAYY